MAQYESGQYINEFLDNMPNLLLTMRKMDVDQMLKTRRLDQIDIGQNLDQERFNFDSLIKDRQMSVLEAESGISLEERAEAKRGREAWRKIKEPLTQAMQQNLQLDEEYREQIKDMPWYQKAFRLEEEDFLGIESERTRAERFAEEKYGEPRKPSEIFGDVKSLSAELTPPQFMQMYTDPYFQPQMLGKTGLMGLTTAGLVGGQYP
jgi:hypothetical protein